jgi:hypothetical protein
MPNTTSTEPTRENLARELREVQAQLDRARRRRDADAIAYASTPDGAAETFRRFELSRDEAERKQLKTTYLSGLKMAAEEFEERSKRGNAGANDGPLAVIPVGAFTDPVAKVLVGHRVMGTFRNSTESLETHKATVTLLRLLPDGQTRKRSRVDTTAEFGVLEADLASVVSEAWSDPAVQKRLRSSLLDEDVAAALTAALSERNAAR